MGMMLWENTSWLGGFLDLKKAFNWVESREFFFFPKSLINLYEVLVVVLHLNFLILNTDFFLDVLKYEFELTPQKSRHCIFSREKERTECNFQCSSTAGSIVQIKVQIYLHVNYFWDKYQATPDVKNKSLEAISKKCCALKVKLDKKSGYS